LLTLKQKYKMVKLLNLKVSGFSFTGGIIFGVLLLNKTKGGSIVIKTKA
jgi:hypothetical protein